jgi:cytidylate kinase
MNSKKLTIAIDGHSSCGKSTVAKSIAKQLGYTYIDTGAMYRAVTLYCIKNNIINNGVIDEEKLKKHLDNIKIHFTYDKSKDKYLTWLNNNLIEDEIREIEVSNNVSLISKIGFVRERMVQLQREMGKNGGVVMDGRDIGTVVFPDADVKLFMTASADVRAKRRYDELTAKGSKVSFDEIKKNIEERDFIDQNREIAPLKQADDAVLIDNSNLTREEQLNKILEIINAAKK